MPTVFDTETCGFHGPIVLLQYQKSRDSEIILHEPWHEPIWSTIQVIEEIVNDPTGIIGFNLAFDWFHLCQMYTTLCKMSDTDKLLIDCMDEYAITEPLGRDGPCLKPHKACDVMLHARKGMYQSMMNRDEIRIRRVPTLLAYEIARYLERTVKFKDIYFAKRSDKFQDHWQVTDCHKPSPDFKDIVVRFQPSSGLKALAADAFDIPPDGMLMFHEIEVSDRYKPIEYGFAPFATAVGRPGRWKGAWPDVIHAHIAHWKYNTYARKYATNDVKYTSDLYDFLDCYMDDDDSVLACMVGAVRWRGYKINIEGIKQLKKEATERKQKAPKDAKKVRAFLEEVMTPLEKTFIAESTKKPILAQIIKDWKVDCESCGGTGDGPCANCSGTGGVPHPAALRAELVAEARTAAFEENAYAKLLRAGRFHVSLKVIGALSSRMSGSDGLNAQGMKKSNDVRSQFILAFDDDILSGGDFDAFEVTIADMEYNDPELRAAVLSGKTIHGIFGTFVYPHLSYEQILASKGHRTDDYYTKSKSAVFAMFYGGEGFTLQSRLGVPLEIADKAYQLFRRRFPGVGQAQRAVEEMFTAISQPKGLGTKVYFKQPADFVESRFGFRRYFTVENRILGSLYQLATNMPPEWENYSFKVTRRDKEQSALGAARSALYGAAFGIQGSTIRKAKNHKIQSAGASITKALQRRLWDQQPAGISRWLVQPFNIHDEIMCVMKPEMAEASEKIVNDFIKEYRAKVPLLDMKWKTGMKNWAEK